MTTKAQVVAAVSALAGAVYNAVGSNASPWELSTGFSIAGVCKSIIMKLSDPNLSDNQLKFAAMEMTANTDTINVNAAGTPANPLDPVLSTVLHDLSLINLNLP